MKRLLLSISLVGLVCLAPLQGQDYSKFAFNMGGGITTPLNPTGAYAGISSNFVMGGGYNVNKSSAVIAELMWSGLPSNHFAIQPIKAPTSNISLYSLTVNYRRQFDRINNSPFGLYFIGGGGWYMRKASIDQSYTIPVATPCQPYWVWYGYSCSGGVVATETVASKAVSAGGLNGGFGFTIRFADSNLRFFTEARYHYAWSERIPTTMIPVTIGIRYN